MAHDGHGPDEPHASAVLLHAVVKPLPIEALPRDGRAPLDVEAGRHAWEEYEAVAGLVPARDAVLLACLAYQRHLDARRAMHSYTTAQGVRIARQHRQAVREALSLLRFHGGEEGPRPEDAMAHALVAAEQWWERHLAGERAHERHHRESAERIAADLAAARERARVHSITSRK